MFGSYGGALKTSLTFVSQASIDKGTLKDLGLQKPLVAVKNIRGVTKADMIHNDWCGKIEVDPENYQVHADGVLLTCEPASSLPMAQRYFLF